MGARRGEGARGEGRQGCASHEDHWADSRSAISAAPSPYRTARTSWTGSAPVVARVATPGAGPSSRSSAALWKRPARRSRQVPVSCGDAPEDRQRLPRHEDADLGEEAGVGPLVAGAGAAPARGTPGVHPDPGAAREVRQVDRERGERRRGPLAQRRARVLRGGGTETRRRHPDRRAARVVRVDPPGRREHGVPAGDDGVGLGDQVVRRLVRDDADRLLPAGGDRDRVVGAGLDARRLEPHPDVGEPDDGVPRLLDGRGDRDAELDRVGVGPGVGVPLSGPVTLSRPPCRRGGRCRR